MEIGIHEIIFHKFFLLEHNFNIKENRIFFEGVIEWKRNILVWSLRANLLEAINWSLLIGVN